MILKKLVAIDYANITNREKKIIKRQFFEEFCFNYTQLSACPCVVSFYRCIYLLGSRFAQLQSAELVWVN